MHRSRGTLPVRGGRPPRRGGRGAASAKGRASTGLPTTPATPEALRLIEAFRTGVRHSPRFAAAAATGAAAPADDGDDEYCGGESQPLLSPPACVPTTYVCNWAQAIQCMYSTLKPMPCQREGCDFLVHHLCQGAWERQKGYEDTVARLCCLHHPDYKYEHIPSKVSVAVANAQDVMSKAKVLPQASLGTQAREVLSSFGGDHYSDNDDSNQSIPRQ